MAGELIIGIDVGTTAVKVGLLDQAGKVRNHFGHAYPTQRGNAGIVEQDAEQWLRPIETAFTKFSSEMSDVVAIGICSQVNTHLFVDRDGNPLAPAILWQDGRADVEAKELDAAISLEQRIAWWGAPMPIDASHVLSRMLWMARHRPDIWEQTAWVMLPKDYCLLKLTGELATDGLSNIGLVDQNLQVIPEVLELVPGAAERVVPVRDVLAVVGKVQSGPAAGIPVANGTMDAWAGLVGCGATTAGTTAYLSGTSEILGISSPKLHPTEGVIVFPECEHIRIHAGPTQSGGAAKLWYGDLTGQSPTEMAANAAASDFSRPAPIFIPHLQGERAPIWKAHTRGVFLGLDQTTSQADMARSIYEGVAFSARMALEAVEQSAGVSSSAINCGGGGFQSDIWNQIRADILGCELRRVAVRDTGILGAAGIASAAIGLHGSVSSAFDQIVGFDKIYQPDMALHKRYDTLFDIYVDAIAANEDLNRRFLDVANASLPEN
ncbi:MAG: FGGY family carbohydrate kinase [Hyphomicrobiales bacterium]